MTNDIAAQLKQDGNIFFKAGRLAEAIQCYSKAEAASPLNAIYPSNLSAALYEAGDYLACIEAISRAWKLVGPDANPDLAPRLSTRLAKALCQSIRNGTIPESFLASHSDTITEMQLAALIIEGTSEDSNNRSPWEDWKLIESEGDDRTRLVGESRIRLSSLPIFKKASKVLREFYTIGQDKLMSLLDDWGPEAQDQLPLKVKDMTKQELSNMAFLFGGVGDARHVYGTIAGLSRTHSKLPRSKLKSLRIHLTLIDVHPGALARDLCIFMLVNDLLEGLGSDPVEKAEILCTILYTFFGALTPDYCHRRLHEKIDDLKMRLSETPPRFPKWIHIDQGAINGILNVLDFWSTVDNKFDTAGMLNHHVLENTTNSLKILEDNPHISPAYRQSIQESLDRKRKKAAAALDKFTDQQMRNVGLTPLPARASPREKEIFAQRREEVINKMIKLLSGNSGTMADEKDWYERTKVFLPPTCLWSRHPGFEVSRGLKTEAQLDAIDWKPFKKHIIEKWLPNSTLFDREKGTYPNIQPNPFETPLYIEEFSERLGLGPSKSGDMKDTPTYGNVSHLITTVVSVLKALKGQIKLEFLCGELTHELAKMRLGADGHRPAEFPRSFNRTWLSNCPDYTHGIINTIVFAVPTLRHSPESVVGSNCLMNSGIWKDDDEYVYTYTLLRPEDVERFLGCRLLRKAAMHGTILVGYKELPRPLSELASREELLAWLSRVLIYTVIPGTGGQTPFRARLPNNLVAFVHLLIYLQKVGYPSHWLGDFLQTVISGRLVTDVLPYLDKWPIPLSDVNRRTTRRAVRLDPWRLEFENILAHAYQALPFSVSIPRDFTLRPMDIAIFEASAESSDPTMGTIFNPVLITDPGVCLIFYKRSKWSAQTLITTLPDILNGSQTPPPGQIHVLTAQEMVDLPRIRWRLSKERVRVMRDEDWAMVGFRTDVRQPFTYPVPAKQWREVQGFMPIAGSEQ